MMQSFTIRTKFQSLLQQIDTHRLHLKNLQHFILNHQQHALDLFNCILERITTEAVLYRLNYLYLLDIICTDEHWNTNNKQLLEEGIDIKENVKLINENDIKLEEIEDDIIYQTGIDALAKLYKKLIIKNGELIFKSVVDNSRSGKINQFNVEKILLRWDKKGLFPKEWINNMKEIIYNNNNNNNNNDLIDNTIINSKEIFHRIEEDRERNKWLKEENWFQSYQIENEEFEEWYSNLLKEKELHNIDNKDNINEDITFLESLNLELAQYLIDNN